MKTGVSCSKVIAELALVRTKATIKEMLAPKAKSPNAMARTPMVLQRGQNCRLQAMGTEMAVTPSSWRYVNRYGFL